MAAHHRITLLLFFLLTPLFLKAQALPKHTYLVGGCKASATEALEIFSAVKTAPQFDLYIVCDAMQWHALALKNDFKESAHSFTVLHKGMIWLGPKALANLHEAIEHELEHLRCDCDLGERNQ